MSVIKENYIVKKRNILNELRANNMSLQELRFFAIYLSKINSNDINTRVVRFTIDDFKAIMELGRMNIDYMKTVTNNLLSKVVNIPDEKGGYEAFQLFKRCKVSLNEFNEWFFEIDAHDQALPLMFDFKEKYFSYPLWNALRLKSSNQLRMYELLKQYQKLGMRILSIEELKRLLFIDKKEYLRFGDFKIRVLDACKQAIGENTDIKFTYEPYGKKGKGGKILFLKFLIQENKNYIDQLTLDKFIEQNQNIKEEPSEKLYESRIKFLCDACENEFSEAEITVLYNLMFEVLPYDIVREELKCYDYLLKKYNELKMRNNNKKILHRFAYMKSLISMK